MPSIIAALQTQQSESDYVKQFTLAGATIYARTVLTETSGSTWNVKTQPKRYALAKKILGLQSNDSDSQCLSSLAREIVNVSENQFFFTDNTDINSISSFLNGNPTVWNTIAGVTGDDLI